MPAADTATTAPRTRTTTHKIYYYRCLGSDDYRYEGGRVCANKPVRADLLDELVWNHITDLLADPRLIRAEIDKRLEVARTSDPVRHQRARLESALAKARTAITRMIEAYSEQLLTIDELRSRMPQLRGREANLTAQIHALDAQIADRDAYLKLADDLEGFLARLREKTATASIEERQRVLRLLVKDVLVGPEKITIRHRIPVREHTPGASRDHEHTDAEDGRHPSYPLRWRGERGTLRGPALALLHAPVSPRQRRFEPAFDIQQHPRQVAHRAHRLDHQIPRHAVEERPDIEIDHPVVLPAAHPAGSHGIERAAPRTVTVGIGVEDRFRPRLQNSGHHRLRDPIPHGRHTQNPGACAVRFRDLDRTHRRREVTTRGHPVPDLAQVALQILLERLDRHPVHPGCTPVRLDLLPCLPDSLLRNHERLARRLQLIHATPPENVGWSNDHSHERPGPFAPPPLQGHRHYYEPVRRRTRTPPGTPSPVPCGRGRPGSRRLYAGHRLARKRTTRQAHPEADLTPRFRCQLLRSRHVHDDSLAFAFPVPT